MTNPTTAATEPTGPRMRNRGVFRLDERILEALIDLPKGQRIIGFRDNPISLCIEVHVEGPGLPEVAPMTEPPIVNTDEYVTLAAARWAGRGKDLAEMVGVITEGLDRSADGDSGAWASELRRVLDGSYDPRVRYSTVEIQAERS